LARTGPRCKKNTGVRYCPIAEFLAQASTGRAKNEVQRAKGKEQRAERNAKQLPGLLDKVGTGKVKR